MIQASVTLHPARLRQTNRKKGEEAQGPGQTKGEGQEQGEEVQGPGQKGEGQRAQGEGSGEIQEQGEAEGRRLAQLSERQCEAEGWWLSRRGEGHGQAKEGRLARHSA